MTTCPFCLDNMASRSQRELTMRKAKISRFPQVKLSECPQCKGTEWATTTDMIEAEVFYGPPTVPDGLKMWIYGMWAFVLVGLVAYIVLGLW